jgi:hypothetical protein
LLVSPLYSPVWLRRHDDALLDQSGKPAGWMRLARTAWFPRRRMNSSRSSRASIINGAGDPGQSRCQAKRDRRIPGRAAAVLRELVDPARTQQAELNGEAQPLLAALAADQRQIVQGQHVVAGHRLRRVGDGEKPGALPISKPIGT